MSWATQAGMNYLSVQSTMGNEWDNQAMFDFAGNALPSLRAFKQAGAQINLVKMQVSKAMDQRPVLPIGKPGFNKEPLRVRSKRKRHFLGTTN